MPNEAIATGRAAIEELARRFPQLYVAPAPDASQAHRLAATRGAVPNGATLDHFSSSADDALFEVLTPAGPVDAVFLAQRKDFETFLQIVGHKSTPTSIARTVGAITYTGLADWGKVAHAHACYVATGGTDWPAEFARLARDPSAFRTELIVVSEGPYSNVSALKTPFDANEWVRLSREIRLKHECAHVVCRRLMPTDVLPIWDEVTADVVGLLCACGSYDASLAATFLGITSAGYEGGRLAEYLSDAQLLHANKISRELFAVLQRIEEQAQRCKSASDPFAFLLDLKRHPLVAY